MPREYEIGDRVWYVDSRSKPVRETCEVCYGKLVVTVVLGNGDEVVTPCDFCGLGYQGPRGYREDYQWVSKPEIVEITSKNVTETANGREFRYGYGPHKIGLNMEDVFETEAEAAVKAQENQLLHEARETANKKSRKEHNYKSYSWHVGYHMKEAKNHHQKAEYHERRAVLCKAASRKSNAGAESAPNTLKEQ